MAHALQVRGQCESLQVFAAAAAPELNLNPWKLALGRCQKTSRLWRIFWYGTGAEFVSASCKCTQWTKSEAGPQVLPGGSSGLRVGSTAQHTQHARVHSHARPHMVNAVWGKSSDKWVWWWWCSDTSHKSSGTVGALGAAECESVCVR